MRTEKSTSGVRTDLMHGPVFKSMVLFALPILVSEIFQQLYNTMDTVIIGHALGEKALAAMGACASIYEMLVGFAIGVGNGLAIVVSRTYGANEQEKLKKAVAASAVIGIGITLVLAAATRMLLYPLLELLNTPAEIIGEAFRYISTITLFVGVMFAYNLCAGLLRAIGNSVMPLIFLIISSVLNIALDFWFIYGLKMGVEGAAAATVIAQAVSALLCIAYILFRSRILIPQKWHFCPDMGLYRELLGQGLSIGFMNSIVSVGSVALQSSINRLGYLTIAGHEAARRVMFFCMMPLNALANAASVLVSQNKGADNRQRIRRAMRDMYLASATIAVFAALVMVFLAPSLIGWISGSAETVILQNGSCYLRVSTLFFAMLGIVISTQYALQGVGRKVRPLFASAIELAGKILFAVFLVPRFGYAAVIVCEPFLWTVMAAYLATAFYRDPYVGKYRHEPKLK